LAEFDIIEEDLFVLDKPFKLIKNPIKNSTKRVVKEKYDQIPSSDFAAMLLEVFFIPKTDIQNL
jgi:hypothetical protein